MRVLFVNNQDGDHYVRLIVWDGSGDSHASSSVHTQLLQDHSAATPPPRGVLKEIIFDSCWGILREMGFTDKLLSHWCRFRNLLVEKRDEVLGSCNPGNDVELHFREGTSLIFVPEYVQDVQDRIALVNGKPPHASAPPTLLEPAEETTSVVELVPSSSEKVWTLVPEDIRSKVPITSLAEVQASDVVPRKYHCLARIVKMWPEDITKIAKLQHGSAEFIYSFVLRLEDDASATTDVIVYGKDAVRNLACSCCGLVVACTLDAHTSCADAMQEHFLHGIPPCDLATSTSSRIVLEKRFAALFKSPQLLHCCVKSYYPPTKSAAKPSSVRYRLFDTLLQYRGDLFV